MGRRQVNRVCAPGHKTFVIGYLRMSGLVRAHLPRRPVTVGAGATNNFADPSADSVRVMQPRCRGSVSAQMYQSLLVSDGRGREQVRSSAGH
jgi:hypothetical protein